MMLSKILPDSAFQKIFNILNRYNFKLKIKQTLIMESTDQKGGIVYEDLMSFYKQLITSCELPLEEFIGGSIKKEEASFLYNLIIQEKPNIVLQVGTFLGFSTLIIAEALKHNGAGKIYTIDPEIPHRKISNPVDIARKACKERELSNRIEFKKGWFSSVPYPSDKTISNEVIGPALIQKIGTLDFVFIDGEHSILSTISDFAVVVNFLKVNSICAIHDVCSLYSVKQALTAILSDKSIERIFDLSILKGHDGLAVFRKVNEYVSVRIRIKDKLTQKPVPGIVLYSKAHGKKAVTDLKGEIYIPTILADKYCIDIIANGYKSLHNYCFSLDPHRPFQELTIEVEQEK